jgi:hypothetical protein
MAEPYQYRESGLDDVWLVNGFTIRDDPAYGPLIFISDIDGLHRAIVPWHPPGLGPVSAARHRSLLRQSAGTSLFRGDIGFPGPFGSSS